MHVEQFIMRIDMLQRITQIWPIHSYIAYSMETSTSECVVFAHQGHNIEGKTCDKTLDLISPIMAPSKFCVKSEHLVRQWWYLHHKSFIIGISDINDNCCSTVNITFISVVPAMTNGCYSTIVCYLQNFTFCVVCLSQAFVNFGAKLLHGCS